MSSKILLVVEAVGITILYMIDSFSLTVWPLIDFNFNLISMFKKKKTGAGVEQEMWTDLIW